MRVMMSLSKHIKLTAIIKYSCVIFLAGWCSYRSIADRINRGYNYVRGVIQVD